MRDAGIDWDDEKAESNIKKHGLSFDEAQKVFNDPNALEIYDEEHSTFDEDRFIVIGKVDDKIIVNVVFMERDEKRRIVTARLASKKEWRLYYDQFRS